MDTHTILVSHGLSTSGSDITYRAYVPYDDPSGRDLLAHISEFLPKVASYITIPLVTYVMPILVIQHKDGTYRTAELRSTWLCTSILSHDNPN